MLLKYWRTADNPIIFYIDQLPCFCIQCPYQTAPIAVCIYAFEYFYWFGVHFLTPLYSSPITSCCRRSIVRTASIVASILCLSISASSYLLDIFSTFQFLQKQIGFSECNLANKTASAYANTVQASYGLPLLLTKIDRHGPLCFCVFLLTKICYLITSIIL